MTYPENKPSIIQSWTTLNNALKKKAFDKTGDFKGVVQAWKHALSTDRGGPPLQDPFLAQPLHFRQDRQKYNSSMSLELE